jgi:hypothetical protein
MPGLVEEGNVFLGNTPAPHRAFLARALNVLGPHYDRLVIPCAGKFASVESAVTSLNWKMNQIETSDISLFSTVLGRYIMQKPIDDLNIQLNIKDADSIHLVDHVEVMFQQKLAQMEKNAKSYHNKLYVEDLVRRKDFHMKSIEEGMKAMRSKVGGIQYEVRDAIEHMESAASDEKAVIWINPPAFQDGYIKMFDTVGKITWDEPDIQQFDSKSGYLKLEEIENNAEALVLRLRFLSKSKDGVFREQWESDQEKAVFAGGRDNVLSIEYILCNRPDELTQMLGVTVIPKRIMDIQPYKAPLMPEDHEITEDSKIVWVTCSTGQAMYYRDLFAHRLGATGSEKHILMLIDGYVAGVVGLHMHRFRSGNLTYGKRMIEETYGFSVPSNKYARLNRLLMMSICTKEFQDWAVGPDCLYEPQGLATTCLSRYEEVKVNRGILKLKNRERKTGGLMAGTWFKLRYAADSTPDSYSEVTKKWLAKHAKFQRTINLSKKITEPSQSSSPSLTTT